MLTVPNRKFFGNPNGSKPAKQQSKLSFATRAAKKTEDDEAPGTSVKTPEDDSKVKLDPETKENADPAESKKRDRSGLSPKDKAKQPSTQIKSEDPEEDEEEAPASKRPRRSSRKTIEEDDEDEIMADDEPVKPSKSPKAKKASPKKAAPAASRKKSKPQPKEEDEPPVKEEASATESASEVDDVEEEEEKPEVAAKVREKVQTKLKSKAKDPYPDWKEGSPVPYAALCTTFSLIELTSKRLEITEHCSLFLRQVLRLTPDDFLPVVNLMINKLAPDYAGIELGIGESLIMKAIGETTGRSLQVIKADQKDIGDLGLVAVKSRSTQPTMFKPKPLTVRGVHKGLMDIATVTGNGAQGRKVDGIKKLLSAADAQGSGKIDINKDKGGPSEAKFIVRFLEGKLRLGLAEKTVLVSVAQATIIHEFSQQDKVPSTTDMEKAEQNLKTVYRYEFPWLYSSLRHYADFCLLASFPAGMSLCPPC